MTVPLTSSARTALAEKVAATVESVPGVAFLRPGLADRLRSTLPRSAPAAGAAPAAGVRLTRPREDGPWHVEIHVVALRPARTVEVARAVRDAVERRLAVLLPAPAARPAPTAPTVTVTVTGLV
ncbi:hypothetical protein ABZ782_24450 [Streptomyces asoensis]|uniref:hypothetical protein n=1 Tax=Streptomyces asoensis TaxID=249586 RepID=UPI0033FEC345